MTLIYPFVYRIGNTTALQWKSCEICGQFSSAICPGFLTPAFQFSKRGNAVSFQLSVCFSPSPMQHYCTSTTTLGCTQKREGCTFVCSQIAILAELLLSPTTFFAWIPAVCSELMQYLFQVHLTFLASRRRFQLETVAPPLIGFTTENFLNQTNQWDLNFQLGVDLRPKDIISLFRPEGKSSKGNI